MDFIKEVILTFSLKDKERFERFLVRNQVKDGRKDVLLFKKLYQQYLGESDNRQLKGGQNYHAIRKRISKELVNFLLLKKSSSEKNNIEGRLEVVQYFIDLSRYSVAWELLIKEEKKLAKLRNHEAELRVQQLKLSVLPYHASSCFEETKQRITILQKQQIRKLQFNLSFVQIQKELREKMTAGEIDAPNEIVANVFKQYTDISEDFLEPVIYLKIIEIIRGEYLVQRKYKAFAKVAQEYYDKIVKTYSPKDISDSIKAQLEYIMAHAYFRVRNFNISSQHILSLYKLIEGDNKIRMVYMTRYLSLKSSIDVFEGKLTEAISLHEQFIERTSVRLSLKEQLNLSLNLVAYYCCAEEYRKANRIFIFMNQSDGYYQRHMGREWLMRKELIRTLIQVELQNEEIAISILESLKKKHTDMFKTEQYAMVQFYINTVLAFLNDPHQTTASQIEQMEAQTNFQKDRLFDDPKLLSFYVWLKAKITKQNLYELLKKEYQFLN